MAGTIPSPPLSPLEECHVQCPAHPRVPTRPTIVGPAAVVYCEANFGQIDGKTANGLVRHSERYEILSVIDSRAPASTPA